MRKAVLRCLAPLLLAAIASGAACVSVSGPSSGDTPAQVEQEIFKLVNDHRRSIGAAELTWNDTIAAQARLHSQSMAAGTVPFGHDGFDSRIAVIGQTIPWKSAAEVVALGATAADMVNAWIASAEHRPYIEGDYNLTGVGVAKDKSGTSFYATQIFIKPR
ncbi:MAG: CAP domain-containing protein [Candidatus Aminicenantales bacterium]|jgi:uncharacterized protein YkwD